MDLRPATASELIMEWVGEARSEGGPKAGDRALGEGQPAPPHQLGGLRERCKLPQRGPGRPPKGFLVFCAVRLPFPAYQYTCCIQFAWI